MATEEEISLIVNAQTQNVVRGLDKVVDKLEEMDDSLDDVSASAKETSKNTGGLGMALGKVAGVMGSVVGAAMFVGKGLRNAGIKEQGEVQFGTLLGSAEAAKQRMQELATFANATPFSNEQVVQMSKTLQAMTGGALASGDGLRLVGDTAAALNPGELERFSLHIGRMFSQIKSGQAFGESLKELQELGAISGDVAAKLREMSSTGNVTEETWNMVRAELEKNSGAMENLAGTFDGSMSTLLGTANDVLADAFMPITTALTPVLGKLTAGLEAMRPKLVAIGEAVGTAINYAVAGVEFIMSVFASGQLGTLVTTSLLYAGATFVNYLMGGLKLVFDSIIPVFVGVMTTVADPSFWGGVINVFASLGNIFNGLGLIIIGSVLEAGQNYFGFIVGAQQTAVDILKSAAQLAGATLLGFIAQGAMQLIEVGQKLKLPGMDKLAEIVGNAQVGIDAVKESSMAALKDIPATFERNKEAARSLFEDAGQGAKELGKSLIATGFEQGKEGGKAIGGSLAGNFGKAFEGVSFQADDMFDTDPMKDKLKNIVDNHWTPPLRDMQDETDEAANNTGEMIAETVNPDPVADSLSKIGGGGNLFVAAAEAATGAAGLGGGGLTTSGTGGLGLGADTGSSGLGPGGSVGGSAAVGVLQSIDQKISEIITIMSNPAESGGGLTLDVV